MPKVKFPANDIITWLDDRLEYNLMESTNKDLIHYMIGQ